jgi:hypothetical protein
MEKDIEHSIKILSNRTHPFFPRLVAGLASQEGTMRFVIIFTFHFHNDFL